MTPEPPSHSRWQILEEVAPDPNKKQAKRRFRVRCSCGSDVRKTLAYRYVIYGESLSCGCLVRERAAEVGRENRQKLF